MTERLPQISIPETGSDPHRLDAISARTRSLVFSSILSGGPTSRTQLARQTGLSPSTVTKVVMPLLETGYLVEVGLARSGSGAGRPQRMLAVNHERHVVVGVKLHPSSVSGVLTDMGSRVIARASRRLRSRRLDRTLDTATRVIDELLAQGPDASPLGLGVAVGGHVHHGVLVHSGVLGWDDVDVADQLTDRTGLPTVLNNDLNALTIAERLFGKGRGVDSFAVVTIGAGVGCGLMLRGELHTGATGLAGELGHLPLVPGGPHCSCGNDGCLEALASTDAILRRIRQQDGADYRELSEAIRLAHDGNEAARAAFADAGDALGRGLATLCNILNLERIILSGEGVTAHDLFRPALDRALQSHAFSTAARDCDLVIDAVDDYLWARGAASLVIHEGLRAIQGTNGISAVTGGRV